MIRRQSEQVSVQVKEPQNGAGLLTMKKILNGPEEMDQKGRAFNHCFLDPGSGLGYHEHNGTMETMYILKGQAEYVDESGNKTVLYPGDLTITDNGQGHSIYAVGTETLEFIALVLYK